LAVDDARVPVLVTTTVSVNWYIVLAVKRVLATEAGRSSLDGSLEDDFNPRTGVDPPVVADHTKESPLWVMEPSHDCKYALVLS